MHEKSTLRALGVPSIDAASRGVRVYDACPPPSLRDTSPRKRVEGLGARCFCRLAAFLPYRSRMQKAGLRLLGGLKPTLRVPSISTAWRCFFRTLKNAKSRFAPARWAEVHPTPPQCLHRLGAVIVVVSYQRRAGREWGRRNGVLRCRAVSPTRRAGGRQFPVPGFSGGI